jgi:hypothetical protein
LILTSDGSWTIDYSYQSADNAGTPGQFNNYLPFPAGTITTPVNADSVTANTGGFTSNHQLTFVQMTPSPGEMIWHEEATTTGSNACHLSIEYIPEAMTSIAGARHAATRATAHLKPGFLGLH